MEKYPLIRKKEWIEPIQDIGRRALANFGKTFHYVFDHIQNETPSEHFRGAAAELDSHLYDKPQPSNRWDSLGDYHREV